MKASFWSCFLIVLSASGAVGQARSGLPFDLDYLMSRQQTVAHLHLLDVYKVESGNSNTLAYVLPDPATDTKNGLFFEFKGDRLIEIASMKTGLTSLLFTKYMTGLLSIAEQWKAAGVETIVENKEHCFYQYRDSRSYMTISGGAEEGDHNKSRVMTTFTERNAHDSAKRN
jgi:hypothetical protein